MRRRQRPADDLRVRRGPGVLDGGDKVLVIHRRLFEGDEHRFFVGVVERCTDAVAVVTGRTWVRDPFSGQVVAKQDERTKLIPLAAGTFVVYRLPAATDAAAVRIEQDGATGRLLLTDDRTLLMDLSERVQPRAA
jgi:hypothetical protein